MKPSSVKWVQKTETVGGKKHYWKSQWELNYVHYLEWLKSNNQIQDWEYEPKTFWFEGIKRGVVSYKPDFLVTERDGEQKWHEVKGWFDKRSKTKLKRMKIYHPKEKIILIDKKAYNAIKRKVIGLVPGWV